MRTTVYACFGSHKLASRAAAGLVDHGLHDGDLSVVHGPTFGDVAGSGPLAESLKRIATEDGLDAAKIPLTRYFKIQGLGSEVVAYYEYTIQTGGAVLGATIPSFGVDEGRAWTIFDKFEGSHVTS